ncbi:MAG TPA: hypothetical protein VEL71_02970 [Candidatus Dormibacteraeota bacterium]|nr:hypothetical protein [Candidatus Dormibacteraeota bacterium]
MATSIGVASYLLRNGDETDPRRIWRLRRFVSKPPLPFLIFLLAVGVWTAVGFIFSPWMLNQASLGGVTYYYYSYQIWYIATSALLLVCFVSMPVLSFFHQSKTVQDKKASLSMKIISLCWACFGVLTLFQVAAGGLFLPTSQSIGSVADSLLFMLIAFALREPTILGRIVTSGETVSQAVYSNPSIDTIVLYNTESDRRNLVETFVKDGLATGQDVLCKVTKAEVPFYRAILKGSGLLGSSPGEHSVIIHPLETTVPSGEISSLPSSVSVERRELVDLDELDLDRCQDVIDKIMVPDSTPRSKHVGRIWALNVEGAHAGILDLLQRVNPTARVIDLAMQQDAFSSTFNVKHQDILGNRLLIEYEPTSDYEELVQKFVREFQANVEAVAIFTSAGSPIYRQFRDQRNISLFSFSTKTSSPARLSDEQVLLPERDTSLLLDAVDKLLQALSRKRIGMVFDVFTDIILSQGFEKAYGVLSSVVEMTESENASILVLVNYDALEPRVLGAVQGLFRSQLRFNFEGLKVIKLQGSRQERNYDEERLSGVQEPSGGIVA